MPSACGRLLTSKMWYRVFDTRFPHNLLSSFRALRLKGQNTPIGVLGAKLRAVIVLIREYFNIVNGGVRPFFDVFEGKKEYELSQFCGSSP